MLSWPDFNEAYVSLRFDDGLKSQLNAVKLLNEYNMTASFYIIVEKPDSKIEWERQYYMNWDELRNISKAGLPIVLATLSLIKTFQRRR